MKYFLSVLRIFTGLWGWLLVLAGIAALSWYYFGDRQGAAGPTAQVLPVPQTPFAATGRGVVDVEGGIIEVSARAGGTFREVMVEPGDTVAAGDILAVQLDDGERLALENAIAHLRTQELALEIAGENLSIARRDLERARIQFEGEAVSEQTYDAAADRVLRDEMNVRQSELGIVQARNTVRTREAELELRKVRAPVDGTVADVLVRPGVGASTTQVSSAFVIVPDRPRIVRLNVDEGVAADIFEGQGVQIATSLTSRETYSGSVSRIAQMFRQDAAATGRAGSPELEVIVAAPTLPLRLGQPVVVRFLKPESAAID